MTAVTDKTRDLIAQSKRQPSVDLPLTDIVQSPQFQKRAASTENKQERNSIREQEVNVMKKLKADLEANPEHHAEPVTVCRVDGRLFLVDGHHRYDCYKAAQRDTVPARVIDCSEDEAHVMATILNTYSATVPRGDEEQRQMVWGLVTRFHDGVSWKAGYSARKVAELMNVGAKTVDRMVKARVGLGDDAAQMTWKQARRSDDVREFSSKERLVGWLTALEKINAESEHEQEVLVELIRAFNKEWIAKEELAERFTAYLESPSAFREYLEEDMASF